MADTTSNPARVPRHVAIIMDGNGRWACERGLPRIRGHEEGTESVRAVVRACRSAGVKYLTLYAFSVENWVRPPGEIAGLMGLLKKFLRDQEYELHENKVRLRMMGRMADLPRDLQGELRRVMDATARYDDGHLILALSYGGRVELVEACRAMARDVKAGRLDPDDIDEKAIASRLYLPDVPDPDLLIRTSGEMRVSNFLLWQISYSELYVAKVLWPEFREEQFREAIAEYGRRHRRFGDIK
jgi:undecaprenyl diphosphate synthase